MTYSKYIDYDIWHSIGQYTFTNHLCGAGASATVTAEIENAINNSHIRLSNNGESLVTTPFSVSAASTGVPVNVVVTATSDTGVILDQ